MFKDILVLLPTRGRSQTIATTIGDWHACSDSTSNLKLLIDEDDPELNQYLDELRCWPSATFEIGPRMSIGPMLDQYALKYVDDYSIIGFIGDDHHFRTPEWESLVRQAVSDKNGWAVVYGNDMLRGESLPTQVFFTSNIIKTVGRFSLPGAKHLYLDNYWMALGHVSGALVYLPDLVIEHMHPEAGKAEVDEGYMAVNSAEIYGHDNRMFTAWLHGESISDVEKIRKARDEDIGNRP